MLTSFIALKLHSIPRTDSRARVETLVPSPMSAKRIMGLSMVRGLAMLLTLICHSRYVDNTIVSQRCLFYPLEARLHSWKSADLFLFLSRFLIDGIPLAVWNSLNFFKGFYARGFFRIIPFYAVGTSQIHFATRFFAGVTA